MSERLAIAVLPLLCMAGTVFAQAAGRDPHIGYVYPAGGQRGQTFRVLIGGQALRGATDVHVTGDGVQARVIQHFRPLMNLDGDQRKALQTRMRELVSARLAELPEDVRARVPLDKEFPRVRPASQPGGESAATLPEHPILLDLEKKSLRELLQVRAELLAYRQKQPNPQIAESLLVEVTIGPKAVPGDRELRVITAPGMTNPLRFQVGALPETCECESNDPGALPFLPPEPALDLPVVLNGQVKPGDVDRVRFKAAKGQKLVITTFARELIPYLADAVPGWFQATVALYGPSGEQIASADDYRFDPDPVLYFEVPRDGVYQFEIRDSIYRGREDFVYRVCIAEQPFITDIFPLGGRTGSHTMAEIAGWNLGSGQLPLATPPGSAGVKQTAMKTQSQVSNPVTYAVDMLPEATETEPNEVAQEAAALELPRLINGRIDKPGDVDVFVFEGRAGQEFVAEVHARRLGSPLDSVLHLVDSGGKILAWNDDHEDPESGLLTHHSDSLVRFRLPEQGMYHVRLADAQKHGGPEYAYRLRLSGPRPDFALRATPSSLNLRAGWAAPICVHAFRKDGFDGPIDIVLKGQAEGFELAGARIPAGCDRVWMTVTAPASSPDGPVALQMEGVARIAGRSVRRTVTPAEDMMQAFAYRHLVPSQELVALVTGPRRRGPRLEFEPVPTVRIVPGSTTEVLVRSSFVSRVPDLKLTLREPPPGITLAGSRIKPDGVSLTFKAAGEAVKAGLAGNLIVEATATADVGAKAGSARPGGGGKQRFTLGALPAIPFEVTEVRERASADGGR